MNSERYIKVEALIDNVRELPADENDNRIELLLSEVIKERDCLFGRERLNTDLNVARLLRERGDEKGSRKMINRLKAEAKESLSCENRFYYYLGIADYYAGFSEVDEVSKHYDLAEKELDRERLMENYGQVMNLLVVKYYMVALRRWAVDDENGMLKSIERLEQFCNEPDSELTKITALGKLTELYWLRGDEKMVKATLEKIGDEDKCEEIGRNVGNIIAAFEMLDDEIN